MRRIALSLIMLSLFSVPSAAMAAGACQVGASEADQLIEKILKDKHIQTVIVTGTASNGAVLFTGAGAAMRGLNVIVPVDGMSAVEPYADLTTAYTFATAPSVSAKSTLTRIDMIKF